jgi:hypothetical protein
VSIPLALLDTPLVPEAIEQFYAEARVPWCAVT